QRTERIVHRANHEVPGEPAVELLEHVAEARGLEGRQNLTGASAKLRTACIQLVRTALGSGGGHENHLLGTGGCDFAQQAAERSRPVAQPMRLAAPRPFWPERRQERVRLYT